jgi:hypothetical protein
MAMVAMYRIKVRWPSGTVESQDAYRSKREAKQVAEDRQFSMQLSIDYMRYSASQNFPEYWVEKEA